MLVIIAIATEHSLISLQNWFIASLGRKQHRELIVYSTDRLCTSNLIGELVSETRSQLIQT